MRFPGTLQSWNDERGFGFIEPAEGGEVVFVHIKAFRRLTGRPQPGQPVTFEVELGPQGKKRAARVDLVQPAQVRRPAPGRHRPDSPVQWGTATLFAIPVFLLLFVLAHVFGTPPRWAAAVYPGASVVTFLAYALDKSAARRGAWRTAESSLHLLALAGGWPGALLAQQFLRHKSAKAEFRAVFWVTVVLNVGAFIALSWPPIRRLLGF